MRWEDERYVRLYTRDTATWLMVPWQARAVLPLILRKCDRAGIIDLGADGFEGLAVMLGLPLEVVKVGVDAWIAKGTLVFRDERLVATKFMEAQEANASGTQRQREHRARARDLARAGLAEDRRKPVVYFIQAENGGPVKIGYADDLASRLSGLQVSHPERLVVLATVPGSVEVEREIHERFADLRSRGEWFHPGEKLMAFIASQVTKRDMSRGDEAAPTAFYVTPSRAVPCLAVPPDTAPSVLTAANAPSKREEAFAPTKPERKPRALSAGELCFARCEDARMAAFPGSQRRGLTGNQVARWNGFYRDRLAELRGDEARFLAVVGAYLLDPWARGCDPPCPWAGLAAPEVWERCLHRATQAAPAATGDPCAVDSCPSPRGERTAGKPLCRGHYAEWQGDWMREGSPGATADGDFGAEHLATWLTNKTGARRAEEAV